MTNHSEQCKGCNYEREYSEPWEWHTCGKSKTPEFEGIKNSDSRDQAKQLVTMLGMGALGDPLKAYDAVQQKLTTVTTEAYNKGAVFALEEVKSWFPEHADQLIICKLCDEIIAKLEARK
jgi:hypothetical protein